MLKILYSKSFIKVWQKTTLGFTYKTLGKEEILDLSVFHLYL